MTDQSLVARLPSLKEAYHVSNRLHVYATAKKMDTWSWAVLEQAVSFLRVQADEIERLQAVYAPDVARLMELAREIGRLECVACLADPRADPEPAYAALESALQAALASPQPGASVQDDEKAEDLYARLESLSKSLEGSGRIDEHEQPDAYATVLDAMNFVRAADKRS